MCWAHRAQPKASFPLCWHHGGEQVGAAQPPLHQVLKVDVWFIADSRAPQKQQRLSPFSPPGEAGKRRILYWDLLWGQVSLLRALCVVLHGSTGV